MTSSGAVGPQDPMELAAAWGAVSLGHFKAALEATEAQRKREHEVRMETLRIQELEQRAMQDAYAEQARRADRLLVIGMVAGFILCAGMLVGAVWVGRYQPWLAATLAGPSLVSTGALFVLRRATTPAEDVTRQVTARIPRSRPADATPETSAAR